jgi:hypothetical protein
MPKLPWMKFFPNDWLGDENLRMCSLEARAIWIDMLCIAHLADRRGYLARDGKPLTLSQIARLTGSDSASVSRAVSELKEAGVASESPDGILFSRRIVRDAHKSSKCAIAGTYGATLKGQPKGNGQGRNKGKPKGAPGLLSICDSELLSVYSLYPRKVGKRAALSAIEKAARRAVDAGDAPPDGVIAYLAEATEAYARAVQAWPAGDRDYVPHPATWFNQERYDDDRSAWAKGAVPASEYKGTDPRKRGS